MSAALYSRAEVAKIDRLLALDPAQLDYLEPAPADALRRLRDQITDALFDGDRARLHRLAAAGRIVPGQIAATIAERALGPVLCARLSGLTDPSKAVDIAKRVPAQFLADVAIEMDPRRASDVIARVPTKLVVEVAIELDRRGELVTMGRFVGYVGDEAIRSAIGDIGDTSLLEIAFVMEGKERLDHMISLLDADRLRGLLSARDCGRRCWTCSGMSAGRAAAHSRTSPQKSRGRLTLLPVPRMSRVCGTRCCRSSPR